MGVSPRGLTAVRVTRASKNNQLKLTNTNSDEESKNSKQPVGVRKGSKKTEKGDDESKHIYCMSSAQFVRERPNSYSSSKKTQK